MRTTVTLDSDVEHLLKEAARRDRKSFKEVLNEAVRRGLAPVGSPRLGNPFRVRPAPMGLKPGIDPRSLNRLIDELEVASFLEKEERHRR